MVEGVTDGDLGDFLRAQNRDLTRRRRMIWEIMCGGGRLTAGQITEKALGRDPGIDRLTVERALNLFADMGLALRTEPGDGTQPRWEIVHLGKQFHLICDSCGDTRHHSGVLADKIQAHVADRYAFSTTRISLRVHGVCGRCSADPQP